MRKKTTRFILVSILLLSLAWAGCVTNPVTGRQEFSLMSPSQEISMGAQLYPLYTQAGNGLFTDEELQRYVSRIGKSLASVSHRPDLPYEFNVVNQSVPNAYALPGGKISITRGLLTMMDSEAQLAALLGHEISHVTARHSADSYTKQVMTSLIIGVGAAAIKSPGTRGLFTDLAGLTGNLALMKYSRDHEREADRLGMEYMVRAGYNPRGAEELMAVLMSAKEREPGALDTFFSSHPLTSERLETARVEAGRYPRALESGREEKERFSLQTGYLKSVEPAYGMADEGFELARENHPREARKRFQKAVDMAPEEALLHTYLAALDLSLKDFHRARPEAERALELYPDFFLGRMAAARVHFSLGKYPSSIGHAAKANGLVPDQPGVLFLMGRGYEEIGNIPEAARHFYRLLEVMSGKRTEQTQYAGSRLRQWGYIR